MKFIDAGSPLPDHALLLDNTADVLALAEQVQRHTLVVLQFPNWTDGRAYSQAVLLRSRLNYRGELRATGDVTADMAPLLRRCGFDAIALRADHSVEAAQRALGFFDSHYQTVPPERQAGAAA